MNYVSLASFKCYNFTIVDSSKFAELRTWYKVKSKLKLFHLSATPIKFWHVSVHTDTILHLPSNKILPYYLYSLLRSELQHSKASKNSTATATGLESIHPTSRFPRAGQLFTFRTPPISKTPRGHACTNQQLKSIHWQRSLGQGQHVRMWDTAWSAKTPQYPPQACSH